VQRSSALLTTPASLRISGTSLLFCKEPTPTVGPRQARTASTEVGPSRPGTTRRATIHQLADEIDADGALEAWEAALAEEWNGLDAWVHGDVTGSNLLLRGDGLCVMIDFGCTAVGDPACDLTAAWTMFEGPAGNA